MGDYNPNAPYVTGNQLVTIRDEDINLTTQADTVEYGYDITLGASRTLQDARVYMRQPYFSTKHDQILQVNVYPYGQAGNSGPIQSILVPVAPVANTRVNGTATGGSAGSIRVNGVTTSPWTVGTAPSLIAAALQSPGSENQISMPFLLSTDIGGFNQLILCFDIATVLPALVNKRVLGLNMLLQIDNVAADAQALAFGLNFSTQIGQTSNPGGSKVIFLDSNIFSSPTVQRFKLPAVNKVWQSGISAEALPWNLTSLAQWLPATASTTRLEVQFFSNTPYTPQAGVTVVQQAYNLSYCALEIVYCEENRLATGALNHLSSNPSYFGAQIIPMRTPAGAVNPVLSPGDYTVTVAAPYINFNTPSVIPPLNAVRELYALPNLTPRLIIKPYPPESSLGQTFSVADTNIMPQLTLHTSGGTVPESQVYGRLARAPVFGAITASQGLTNSKLTATQLDQIRFYARHFGAPSFALQITSGASVASITQPDFDNLTEIIDGWREVTLPLNPALSIAATGTSTFTWSDIGAPGAGSRWEILGASAPAVSGLVTNVYQEVVPASQELRAATYLEPNGTNAALSWVAPNVSGIAVSDTLSDAVLIGASSPPAVTGVAISVLSQGVTGLSCGAMPMGIVGALQYNQLSWTPLGGVLAQDAFTRVSASGWGSPTVGPAYTLVGTTAWFTVNGTQGKLSPTAAAQSQAVLNVGVTEQDLVVTMTPSVTGVASSDQVLLRYQDSSNYYLFDLNTVATGGLTADITGVIAGVKTVYAATSVALTAGGTYRVRAQATGSLLRMRIWLLGTTEPMTWNLTVNDLQLSGTSVGVGALSTTTTQVFTYDDINVSSPAGFGYYELQRQDTFDTGWDTIMQATVQSTAIFNDYEARIAIASSYRIRVVNVLGFVGPWSTVVSATIPAPGVTGRTVDNSLLAFTTNERQAGGSNLAYITPVPDTEEALTFPEANRTNLQFMYGKDYLTAFQPLERGGEQFSRTLLVQQMAVAGPLIEAGFSSMRNLAWATVSYVCVRNEIGDRWYANVNAPGGSFLRNRTIQLLQVTVTEQYVNPSIVDPAVMQ